MSGGVRLWLSRCECVVTWFVTGFWISPPGGESQDGTQTLATRPTHAGLPKPGNSHSSAETAATANCSSASTRSPPPGAPRPWPPSATSSPKPRPATRAPISPCATRSNPTPALREIPLYVES